MFDTSHQDPESDVIDIVKLRFCQTLIVLATVVVIVSLILDFFTEGSVLDAPIRPLIIPFAPFAWLWLMRGGNVSNVTNVMIGFVAVSAIITQDSLVVLFVGMSSFILAALLGNNMVYAGIVGAFLIRWFVFESESDIFSENTFVAVVVPFAMIVISGQVRYFSLSVQERLMEAQRNTAGQQTAAEISQITSQLLDLNELFSRTVDLIREQFGYYHVQIFMIDEEGNYANLVASTGTIGRQLMNRGHRLPVGSQSVIGRVTQLGEVIIARDTDGDAIHARNELLPATRAELALPIIGDHIIGALDVQSTSSNAFSTGDIQILQLIANQLAGAISNATLFQAQAESLDENKRLFVESEVNLREIQRLNQQLTGESWRSYLQEQDISHGITLAHEDGQQETWTKGMVQAAQKRRVMVDKTPTKSIITIPVVLRGAVIGALEVEAPVTSSAEDATEIAQAIADRLAISLDNARLFEQAQRATAQEQRINEIAQQYQEASTMDDLLQITLKELKETFGAQQGAIRLSTLGDKGSDHTESALNGGRS